MAINYVLEPNHLTPDPNDQKARVIANNTLGVDDLVKKIAKRGTTLTETDIRAVLNIYFEEASEIVAEGNALNTPLVNLRPSIQGVFTEPTDVFDPKRHTIYASISQGTTLSSVVANATVSKNSGSSAAAPDIVIYNDVKTNTSTIATKGNIGKIVGTELKYDPTNAAEGIFFINTKTQAETKVDTVAQHTATTLMFLVPATLVAGNYYLEVRKAYGNAKAIRKDRYETVLTVS